MKRLALALLLLCTACDHPSEPASAPAASHTASVADRMPAGAPKAQTDLLALIRGVTAAPKDQALYDHFCDVFLHTGTFDGWTGEVSDVRTSTVNQAIDLTLDMGKPMHFEPVVQTTDPLYAKVAALKVGQVVTVSGRFSHAAGSSECVYYLGSYAVTLNAVEAAH